MAGIPIEKLHISARANHVLHGMAIETVEQLLAVSVEKIAGQKNVGAKAIAEIENILNRVKSGEIVIDGSCEVEDISCSDRRSFTDDQMMELSRHSIIELELPVRAFNVLMRADCTTLDKVAVLTAADIKEFKNSGKKTIADILQAIEMWLNDNMIVSSSDVDTEKILINPELKEYYQKLAAMLLPFGQFYWRHLYQYAENAGLTERITYGGLEQIYFDNEVALLKIPELQGELQEYFLKLAPGGIIKSDDLERAFSQQNIEINRAILFDRIRDGTICIEDDNYVFLKREKVIEFLAGGCMDNADRRINILNRRLAGDSLQSIADEFGLTRERIRQIVTKTVRKLPLFFEDYYREPFEYFKFSKQEFCDAFPSCGSAGYEYLAVRYDKGKSDLTIAALNEYSGVFAEQLRGYLKAEALRHDKQTVSKTEMIYRILISNSDRSLSLEDMERVYYDYIDQKGYPRERLGFNLRTVANHLRNAKHIVFNENNCVRYCDADYRQVWKKIDFNQYKNLVISADLIYRDYQDLMEELDIRDGYELFYVIKSSIECWPNDEYQIVCRRVPVIVLGDGDEANQAIHFLRGISPVDYLGYYAAYEERYGLHKESAQGNPSIANALSKYYIDGQYIIDVPAIDERDTEEFKRALSVKKIWFIDDLEKLFKEICVHSSFEALNTAAFKRIGYSLNAGYAYSDRYGSVTNFFDREIFNGDIVDMTELDRRLTTLSSFGSALDKTKKSLEYIEIAPKILMSLQCVERHYGITVEEIRHLQRWVVEACSQKYFNAHSLWEVIKNAPINNPIIEKIQNNEWMCTCIFRQQEVVFSLVVAGGIILAKDSTVLSLTKICEWLVGTKGKMSIRNLTSTFNDTFDTNVPYYKIAERLKSGGNWGNLVTDSFDEYLDTLMCASGEDMDLFQEEFF